jgi:hypothetical protein
MCSIVILLREYHVFTREELMEAGREGFGKRFDGEDDPMLFVVQNGLITMLKAGPHALHVCTSRGRISGTKRKPRKASFLISEAFQQDSPEIWFNMQNDFDFWRAANAKTQHEKIQPLQSAVA